MQYSEQGSSHMSHDNPVILTPVTAHASAHHNAFTLIELSIVLVIIGLIIGGVLVGQDLIRAAELRSAISDREKFDAAVMTFKLKYNCIPGDCPNASGLGLGTNGDGNKRVGAFTNSIITPAEGFRFWQQLGTAGLIAGQYTGTAAGRDTNIGVNVPASQIKRAGYTLYYHELVGHTTRWDANAHWMFLGSEDDYYGTAFETSGSVLTAAEAYNMDAKIDDGYPGSGGVRSIYRYHVGTNSYCATTTVVSTAVYNISLAGNICAMQFLMSF